MVSAWTQNISLHHECILSKLKTLQGRHVPQTQLCHIVSCAIDLADVLACRRSHPVRTCLACIAKTSSDTCIGCHFKTRACTRCPHLDKKPTVWWAVEVCNTIHGAVCFALWKLQLQANPVTICTCISTMLLGADKAWQQTVHVCVSMLSEESASYHQVGCDYACDC